MKSLVLPAVLCLVGLAGQGVAARPAVPAFLTGVKRVVFVGDSLTDGSDYPDYVINTLNAQFPAAKLEFVNAALCGNNAGDLARRLERDILALRPDLVTICIGTNDCMQKRPVAEYARDLEYLIARIQESGAKVLLITPSPITRPDRGEAFLEYVAAMRRLGTQYGCPVAEAFTLFQQWEKAGKVVMGEDGIHHGVDGFPCMARAVLDTLGLGGVPMDIAIPTWPHVLTTWETSDPVPANAIPAPETVKNWHPYDRQRAAKEQVWYDAPFAARGGWMPFALAKPAQPSFAFGRTRYEAPQAMTAEMQIGGATRKIWLNGSLIFDSTDYRGYHPNAQRFPVQLRQGANEIVVLSNFVVFVGIRPLSPSSKPAGSKHK